MSKNDELISIKELGSFLKTDTQSKWGDAYSEISNFILEMQDLKFVFKSGEDYKGKKLPGTITCFDGIEPQRNEVGESIVRFMFGQSIPTKRQKFLEIFLTNNSLKHNNS